MNYYALAKNNNEHSPIFGKYTARPVYPDEFVDLNEVAEFIQTQASVKRFGHVTAYLNASGLIDPAIRFSIYDEKGHTVYTSENRRNNRIVMLGLRFEL